MEEEGKESEQVSDHLICAVCLDLLYKPIVLVCGHVTCLWCCYQSMDKRGQSHCPLCRHPYRHFPAICRMLDIFSTKCIQFPTIEGKNRHLVNSIFSNSVSSGFRGISIEILCLDDKQQNSLGFALDEELDHLSIVDQPSRPISEDNLSVSTSSADENKSTDGKSGGGYYYTQVMVADVLCTACKQLLFQPVVLNCGHVYCEACITIPEDGVIKCHSCECRHPSGFPKVCKELDYVLEEQFPSEYTLRKSSTQLSQKRNLFEEVNEQGSEFAYPSGENFLQCWLFMVLNIIQGMVAICVGFDAKLLSSRGSHRKQPLYFYGVEMCPIIGDRYQCKDCKGKRSYDLCGDCHKTGRKLPGRFNQKHTSQHRLEMVKAVINQDVIYRLLSGQLALLSASRNRTLEFASSPLDVGIQIDGGSGDGDGVGDSDGPTESAIDSRGRSSNQTAV